MVPQRRIRKYYSYSPNTNNIDKNIAIYIILGLTSIMTLFQLKMVIILCTMLINHQRFDYDKNGEELAHITIFLPYAI